MKKIILPVLASLAFAAPALANEARVEVRGGVVWAGGSSEDTWGAAAGYDLSLGDEAFVGLEVSGDKIGTSGTKVAFGTIGRAGVKPVKNARVFAAFGYTTEACDGCGGQWGVGGGLEYDLASRIYIKSEFRHYFDNANAVGSYNALVGGVGMRF